MAWDYGRRGVAGSARAVCAVDKVPSFTLWTLSDSNRFDRNNLIAWIGNTNRFTFSIPSVCPYYQIGGAESKYDDNSFHLCLGLACWPLMAALQLQLLEERTSCSGRCMIIKNQLLIKGTPVFSPHRFWAEMLFTSNFLILDVRCRDGKETEAGTENKGEETKKRDKSRYSQGH
ncbi:hypothetical protein An01g07800 [Aspergillus niger]|uniref:Uncharacterized protein n=2 Tax=Aspergillus niger TaxID=5061 RepID=A2Q9G6_ASPNC|nr:hypothetical protein An01g07800 [Aspergillus niger]CAK43878.1 hypothetical protein An01g07800 [Aspergillus niger]